MGIRICANCVMDESDEAIEFDEAGVCDHCRTFYSKILPEWNYGKGRERELELMAARIRKAGRGRDFDCVLGMSGGIDSSYLLYLAVKKLGLRPLVFHVDGGWNSQAAVNNIEKMVDGLGLDLFTEVINWAEMQDLQRSFFESGVPHIDTPQDHAFFATMYKFAAKYGVRYILTGGNYSTECIRNPKQWMYYQSDSIQLRDIHRKYGSRPLRQFPVANVLWFKLYLPYIRGIKVLRPLDYMEYEKEAATSFLEKEYGFQRYPQKHFESRFTKFYESYWLPEKFGFDTRKVQYSSLILAGQLTRECALDMLSKPAFDSEQLDREFKYIADKLDMSEIELQRCFDAPNRTYRDYRSQAQIYSLGSWVLKRFGIELGGKR